MTLPIPAAPTLPDRADRATFASRADAYVAWEANELAVGVNEAVALLNPLAAAAPSIIATAGYRGTFASLGASNLTIPASTYHLGRFWTLTASYNNASSKVPGTDPIWVEQVYGDYYRFPPAVVSGTVAAITFNLPAGFTTFDLVAQNLSHNGGATANLQILGSSDGTNFPSSYSLGAWSSSSVVGDVNITIGRHRHATLNPWFKGHTVITNAIADISGPISAGNTIAIRLNWSTGASFDAGTVTLYGRKS